MRVTVIAPPSLHTRPGAAEKDIYACLRVLREMGHEVRFCTLAYSESHDHVLEVLGFSHGRNGFIFHPKKEGWRKWLSASLDNYAFFDRAAYVFKQLSKDTVFTEWLMKEKPEVVIGFCSYSWPALRSARRRGIHTVFRSHNYEPKFYFESLSWLEVFYPSNWLRYIAKARGERLAVRYASGVGTLLFPDVGKYKKWKWGGVEMLPLFFVGEHIKKPWVHQNTKPLNVFFLGANYKVAIHLRGVTELIKEIIPEVKKRAPGEFRFYICGANLPQELALLCDGNEVVYKGYLTEEDFEPFLDTMDIGLFPVKTGKTVKGKVADSLCRAFPMVIPDNARGGYMLRDGEETLLAEDALSAVEALTRLKDESLRLHLSKGAHGFAQREFSPTQVKSVFSKLLQ